MTHEGLLQLFRSRPALATELLRDLLGIPLPTFTAVRLDASDLSTTKPKEYHADLVIVLEHQRPVLGIVLEVQLARKANKRRSWPAYLVNLHARRGCPAYLLVIAPDERVATWCAQPIPLGHPGFVLTPLVLGPDAVPVVTDAAAAQRMPELAVLSVMAHGATEQGFAIALAVLKAADALDEERKVLYADLSYISINEAARRKLEEMMRSGYEFQSDFARTYFGKGREEGRKEGRQEGRQEGETRGRAASVLAVLEARGLRVTKATRERILQCSDTAELDRLIRRAAVVSKAADLFKAPAS